MNDNLTDITIVLDRFGSMASVRQDTIGGFNAFLSEQKALPGEANFSLFRFDQEYEAVHQVKPIREVPELTAKDFVPRGSTALLDAIGRTIHETGARLAASPESDRPGKVLVVIMTDGEENSSREFTLRQVFALITQQREHYQWQIAFIGANQDAIATGAGLGTPATNSLNYDHTGVGTRSAFSTLSDSTARYRKGPGGSSAEFFGPTGPEQGEEEAPAPK